MRERDLLRLGLADPMVTNRFLLWGVGSGAACLGSLIGAVAIALTGFSTSRSEAMGLVLSAHGAVAAVAMWLAFLPPPRYRRWIEERSRERDAAVPSDFP